MRLSKEGITRRLYVSQQNLLTPIDILYGHSESIGARTNSWPTAVDSQRVSPEGFLDGGFNKIAVMDRPRPYFDLWLIASKARIDDEEIGEIARAHFQCGG